MIRHCREIGFINEEQTETIITMVDDRNLAVHIYDETLAEKMAERIRGYDGLLQLWYDQMVKIYKKDRNPAERKFQLDFLCGKVINILLAKKEKFNAYCIILAGTLICMVKYKML